MVEENQQLASKIDGDLQTAQSQVTALRHDLNDTKTKISQFSSPASPAKPSKIPSSFGRSSNSNSPKIPVPNGSSKIPVNVKGGLTGEGVVGKEKIGEGKRKESTEENGERGREDSGNSCE